MSNKDKRLYSIYNRYWLNRLWQKIQNTTL